MRNLIDDIFLSPFRCGSDIAGGHSPSRVNGRANEVSVYRTSRLPSTTSVYLPALKVNCP